MLDGLMAIQFKVLTVALPLWLIGATTAPRWLIPGAMLTGLAAPPAVRLALRHQHAQQAHAERWWLRRRAAIVSATGTTIQQR